MVVFHSFFSHYQRVDRIEVETFGLWSGGFRARKPSVETEVFRFWHFDSAPVFLVAWNLKHGTGVLRGHDGVDCFSINSCYSAMCKYLLASSTTPPSCLGPKGKASVAQTQYWWEGRSIRERVFLVFFYGDLASNNLGYGDLMGVPDRTIYNSDVSVSENRRTSNLRAFCLRKWWLTSGWNHHIVRSHLRKHVIFSIIANYLEIQLVWVWELYFHIHHLHSPSYLRKTLGFLQKVLVSDQINPCIESTIHWLKFTLFGGELAMFAA